MIVEAVLGERQRHRLEVQEVAEQHRDVVAPPRVHGLAPAPQLRFVDDVVVDERRGVDELDHRRVQHGALAGVAGHPRRHQQHGRADALAAAVLDVVADRRDQRRPATARAARTRVRPARRSSRIGSNICARVAAEGFCAVGFKLVRSRPYPRAECQRDVDGANPCEQLELRVESRAKLSSGRPSRDRLDASCRAARRSTSATRTTCAGSLRLPRCGTGARNGLSVSIEQPIERHHPRHFLQLERARKRDDARPARCGSRRRGARRAIGAVAGEAVKHAADSAAGSSSRIRNVSSSASRVWITIGSRRRRGQPDLLAEHLPAARRAARSRSGSRGRSRRAPRVSGCASMAASTSCARRSPGRPRYFPAACGWTPIEKRTSGHSGATTAAACFSSGSSSAARMTSACASPLRARARTTASRSSANSGPAMWQWRVDHASESDAPRTTVVIERAYPAAGWRRRRRASAGRLRGWRPAPSRSTRCPSAWPA